MKAGLMLSDGALFVGTRILMSGIHWLSYLLTIVMHTSIGYVVGDKGSKFTCARVYLTSYDNES